LVLIIRQDVLCVSLSTQDIDGSVDYPGYLIFAQHDIQILMG